MPIPQFDIFSGTIGEDAMWIESVEGLEAARKRLNQLASQSPGKYFLYGVEAHAVLASVDTTNPGEGKGRKKISA
jgi:hypothetical protein